MEDQRRVAFLDQWDGFSDDFFVFVCVGDDADECHVFV